MNCDRARRLVEPYVDGELDAEAVVDLERHFEACPDCAWRGHRSLGVREAIRAAELQTPLPPGFAARIGEAVSAEAAPARRPAIRLASPRLRELAAAAAVAVVALGAWWLASGRTVDPSAADAVACHVRSLMADHLMDVPSTDQHTVEPWFDGRVDFAPPVVDLADRGFTLVGGRLDYVDKAPAAALVYQRRRHIVNLFVQPSSGSFDERSESIRGYNVVQWADGRMAFVAVSDLNAAELGEFADAFRAAQ